MAIFSYPTPEGFDDLLMSTDGKSLTGLWFAGSRDENKHLSGVVETRRATSLPDPTYRITNLMGQTMLTGNISAETQQIDIAKLPAGMYFISVGGQTVKFVKR